MEKSLLDSPDSPLPPLVYGLDGRPTSLAEGGELFADLPGRTLAVDNCQTPEKLECRVITVFFVFDQDAILPDPTGPDPLGPVLWGTAVTGDGRTREVDTYRSEKAARQGHHEVVRSVVDGTLRFPA